MYNISDFIWDFGKLPFPTHLGKYFIKIGKIRAKIHEIGKIKAIFGLGMTPIYGLKNGQIKSLNMKVIKLPFACSELSVHAQKQRQTGSFVRTKFGFLHNVPFSFARVLKCMVLR